jgi:hypothetical protein
MMGKVEASVDPDTILPDFFILLGVDWPVARRWHLDVHGTAGGPGGNDGKLK